MPGAVRAILRDLTRDTLKRIEGASLPPVSGLLLQREEEIRAKFGDAVNRKPPERDLEEMWLQVASHWRQRRSLRGLPRRTIRSMPYLLYFLPRNGYRFLDVPALVSEYLSLLQQRPSSRAIRTMIRLFLQEYPREARSFDLLRRNLRSLVAESQNSLLEEWRRRANLYGLFDRTPVQLASVLRTSENPEAVVRDTGMNDEWNNWAILREARAMLWEEAESRIKAYGGLPHDIELLLRSSVRNRRLRIITEKERIALALVRPFQLQPPPMDVRKRIVDFFSVECSYDYGDPRIHRANWMTVDRSVVESLKQWMVEETLEDFFRLFDQTSNQYQWRYREAFWKAYLRKGYIREAWVVLGRRAQDAVQSTGNRSLARYGKLVGAQATQSALLMRIDDLIIAEWTENGSIRIWMEGEPGAPELYAREYDGAALRSTGEAYRHMGSEYGTWQSRVARHIEMFTGLRVTVAEYMP